MNNGTFDDLIKGLALLGLDSTSSKIYIKILSYHPISAKELSDELSIDRVSTYRALKRLKDYGLVEFVIGNPTLYQPIEPSTALCSLLKRKEEELMALKGLVKDHILPRLEELMRAPHISGRRTVKTREFIKLVGGLAVFEIIKRSLRRARTEVIEVISGPALPLHYKHLFDDERECSERGVKVKIISEVTKDNYKIFNEYSNCVEIRHLNGTSNMLRYVIIDRKEAFLRLNDPPLNNSSDFTSLWSNRKVLVSALVREFEKSWKIAEKLKNFTKLLSKNCDCLVAFHL